jgi:1,4-dihydroxy-2-naphthoate octaprenyltransferase
VATVLSNDFFDFKTDKQNKFYGPFTGGSRVIVEKELSHKEVSKGIFTVLVLSFVAAGLLLNHTSAALEQIVGLLLLVFVLALGYTVPPLKLSYRGLGELDVGITHSFGVILCGYVFQGGNLGDPFPWLLSLPLFLGILPSIILAGIPDYGADKASSKSTIAVKLGRKKAVSLAIFFTVLSAVTGIAWHLFNVVPGAYGNAIWAVIPHATILVFLLSQYIRKSSPPPRIDTLMIAALTYMIWFAIIPLFQL